ncbi:hypothetical protein, partial [Streptomyces carpinensis]|uniref:hypothetical protein n=1 Tax=Streptomyces carpinensis TaxID=66369 RepID=UPI001ABF2353
MLIATTLPQGPQFVHPGSRSVDPRLNPLCVGVGDVRAGGSLDVQADWLSVAVALGPDAYVPG